MKLKTINEEEIETMSFDDLAYAILKEKGKKMKINEIFQIICDLQNLGQDIYESRIADFFTLLATEKRFIQLDKGYWDLSENHTAKINLENVEDEDIEEIPEEEIEEEKEDSEIFLDENKDSDDDEVEDEYKDLVVVDEDNESDL